MPDSQTQQKPALRQFTTSYEALGLVVDFVGTVAPFSNHQTGRLLQAVKYQLEHAQHVCAFIDNQLVGYCGWITTTVAHGERWMDGTGRLKYVVAPDADAAALTIVRVIAPETLMLLIRECRRLNPNRKVFFQRQFADAMRPARKAAVANRVD